MASERCPKTLCGTHDWEDLYGVRVCHYCSERDNYLAAHDAALATLTAENAELRAWQGEALRILDRCGWSYLENEAVRALRERVKREGGGE